MHQQRLVDVPLNDGSSIPVSLGDLLNYTFNLAQFVSHLDTAAPVRIFPRLDDPDVRVAFLFLKLGVNLSKPFKLGVLLRLDVERQRDRYIKGVDSEAAVVTADIHEQGLFICQMKVVL